MDQVNKLRTDLLHSEQKMELLRIRTEQAEKQVRLLLGGHHSFGLIWAALSSFHH